MALEKFFNQKLVIKADLKDSLKVLSELFKDLNLPPLLERRISESFLYANETVSKTLVLSLIVFLISELFRMDLFSTNNGDNYAKNIQR